MITKKRIRYRSPASFLLILSVLLACFSGCGVTEALTGETGGVTKASAGETGGERRLWIVTDGEYDIPIEKFRGEYPDVTVETETIPDGAEEQEAYLQQLRTQIMAGKGPDIYIVSQRSTLFLDVEQSMHNGIFTDISEYYDADTELNKDGFVSAVMEAGVLDGARYVLPLGYNIPLLCVNKARLKDAGLSLDSLGTGFSGLEAVAQSLGSDAVIADIFNASYYLLNFLPEVFDYETGNMLLKEAELAAFLDSYKSLLANLDGTPYMVTFPSLIAYMGNADYWAERSHTLRWDGPGRFREIWGEEGCVYLTSLICLTENLRMAKAAGTDLAVLPLRAADGSLVANVTVYGAVGAGCDDPELAYALLRKLLLEEYQWTNFCENAFLYNYGWPVLAEGFGFVKDADTWAAASQYDFNRMNGTVEGWEERKAALASAALTEEDFSFLDVEVSRAVFPFADQLELENMLTRRLDPAYDPEAANTDVYELTRELYREFQWHVAEG